MEGENGVSQPDVGHFQGIPGAGEPVLVQNGRSDPARNEVTSAARGCSFYKDAPENIVAAMSTDRDAWYYNMNHKKRGIAVIFNHENFTNSKLKARCGTKTDCAQLESVLRSLRFEVRSFNDASLGYIMKVIHEVRNLDHTDHDCFLMAVLSHGEQNIIHAHDSPYQPEDLWHPFTADKCPSLAGKPKLFFIQACQGDKLDPGVTLMKRTETDSGPMSYRIPVHADFLIAYSTIPGYFSFRNEGQGSWFMQALCQELKKHCYNLDLLTILTLVNRRVSIDYVSNNPDNRMLDGRKQVFTPGETRKEGRGSFKLCVKS